MVFFFSSLYFPYNCEYPWKWARALVFELAFRVVTECQREVYTAMKTMANLQFMKHFLRHSSSSQ